MNEFESPYNATLLKREDIHEELALFHVALDGQTIPEFEPGQYTTLGLIQKDEQGKPVIGKRGPKLLRRAYSIASAPRDNQHLTFYIVRVEDGSLTPKLWDLEDGDPIFMDNRIKGTFTLQGVPADKNLVFVGTGTGLAPFISMIQQYRQDHRWQKAVLLDGCRVARDLGYLQPMTELAMADPNLAYLPTVTREPDDSTWDGLRGRVTALLRPEAFAQHAGFALDPERCHVFLCGNPAMIDQVEADLAPQGFTPRDRKNPEGNLHFERYW